MISENIRKGALLKIISFSYFAVFLGHSLWRSTFYNYGLEVINLTQTEIAWLFSVASIPGIFAFLLGHIAHKIPLYLVAGCTVCTFGSGLLILGMTKGNSALLLGVVMFSLGFAWYLPIATQTCIRESSKGSVNRVLGRLKSMGPLAAVITAVIIFLYNHDQQIENMFILAGVTLLLIGLLVGKSLHGHHHGRKRTSLHFSRSLWPFYLLNFISGSRSALFKTFVMTQFILVSQLTIVHMSILLMLGSLAGMLGYRMLGVLADKYYPVNILTCLYIIIAGVFAGFIFVQIQMASGSGLILAYSLFLIDSLLFGSSVITDAYLKQVDRSEYIVSDLASGTTFFHLAGVVLPLAGSFILIHSGDLSAVLILGVLISIMGAITSRFLTEFPRLVTAY